MTPLFARLSTDQARSYSLVLMSAGILHTIEQHGPYWTVSVPSHQRRAAQQAIALYLAENQDERLPADALQPEGGSPASAFFCALFLAAVYAAIATSHQRELFFSGFGADARLIKAGELYRCITALLLHVDGAHLLANVVGTLLFGSYAVLLYGWGVAWLLILLSGAMGNLLTALWYGSHHLSVGASTGIFGALGLCAALSAWRRRRNQPSGRRPWVAFAGGLALLAWLGSSPQSDLMAHLFGFLSGLGLGWLYAWGIGCRLPQSIQAAALLTAVALIGGACWWGVIAAPKPVF